MSVRCLPDTKENREIIAKLLKKFPTETEITIKNLINSWMSNNLKDDEDRFPESYELNAWRTKIRGKKGAFNPESKYSYARTSSSNYEVSSRGDKRFSALSATFKDGTIIDGVDVSGKTIEYVYQNIVKKSGKGKAPAKDSRISEETFKNVDFSKVNSDTRDFLSGNKTTFIYDNREEGFYSKEDLEDFSYYEGYLPLWKEWAKQNPELMNELRNKAKGKVLTDMFANTKVSQARALADILNSSSEVKVLNKEGATEFNKLPSYTGNTMTYAGIGSRETPIEVKAKMTEVAKKLESLGYTLNTGKVSWGDNGADQAFAMGTENKELFGPEDATDTTRKIAKELHPNPSALKPVGLNLMARNTNQIFGRNLNTPVDFVLYYAEPDKKNSIRPKGGTGQAVEMANRKGIPTINMMDKDWEEQLDNALNRSKANSTSSRPDYSQEIIIEEPQVKSFTEDMEKISHTFTPITRRNRVNKITRMFNNRVTALLEKRKAELTARMSATGDFYKKRELIDALKKLSRFQIIKEETPRKIFDQIEDDFRVIAEASDEDLYELMLSDIINDPENDRFSDAQKQVAARIKAKRVKAAYKLVLDNWRVLAEEATSNFALTEGVSMDITDDYIERDVNTDSVNEEGNTVDNSKENKEEAYKDGWMTNVREVSSYNSLSNRVRREIANIARVNKRGTQERDDLGDTQYLEPSYVHAVLIQSLRNMVTAEDMLPTLRKTANKLPWMTQVVKSLENDPRLFTSFYRAYRKDYLNYWIQKEKSNPDGSVSFQTISINKSEGTAHYFDEWRDNYEYGFILDTENSMYNTDGEIQLKNAEVGLEVVNDIISKFPREATREDEIAISNNPEVINRIQKVLKMVGISVDNDTLQSSLNYQIDDVRFPAQIRGLLDNLRTLYYDLNKGNEKVKDGKPVDLINVYGTIYNSIAEIINNVDEDSVESNVRQGDKTRYAHINPSYITTIIKKFKRDDVQNFIDSEYKNVNWFYNQKTGEWYNEWLKDLENDSEVREKLDHIVLLEFNKKEYANWTALDASLALINQYYSSPTSGETGFAYYQVPMLSDSQSAEFIRGKRYIEGYENILTDKLSKVVKQEINRINTVILRNNSSEPIDKIANFDIVKKGNKVILGGAEFKFFPELNEKNEELYGFHINEDGTREANTFLEHLNTLVTEEKKEEFIKKEVKRIMDKRFSEAMSEWNEIGLLERMSDDSKSRYKYFERFSEEGVEKHLKEWYWNSTFAQSQIIQISTTDLAYYKNLEDFQKRNKQIHAPAERLNTYATWNVNGIEKPVLEIDNKTGKPRFERVIYLKDFVSESLSINKIEELINNTPWLDAAEKSVIISKYRDINVADAQAYRTLDSFRDTQIMADMWSDEEEIAYNHFKNGNWHAEDFVVLWNTRKPYLYTQKNQSNQVDDGLIRVPTQHKNSEMLLLTNAIFGTIFSQSTKLRVLDEFMTENQIDLAEFESTVKDGKQGLFNINDLNTEAEIRAELNKHIDNPNYVHEFDYNDYGIQTSTPEHGIDHVQLVGTQIRRLIGADANALNDPNFRFKYGNKEWTVDQWFNYFNAVNVANIKEAFEKVDKKFKDNKNIEEILLAEVRSNPRYGSDLKNAVTLDKNGNFNIPLDDPAQTMRIQALLNSILKSRVTKQKIQGGALIQASAYGLEHEPKLVFVYGDGTEVRMTQKEADKSDKKLRLKAMECYMPCPTEELYNLLLDPETHELDVNKKDAEGNYIVPRKYLEAVGYRVPTEDKYSMAPLRIIGFLPRQVGSVIILPRDITTIAGSDFDVDKMYIMFHTLNIQKYDMRKARYYYEKENNLVNELFSDYTHSDLAEDISNEEPKFVEWFEKNKDNKKYDLKLSIPKAYVNNFKFDKNVDADNKLEVFNSAYTQNKLQRDSLMIDLMYSVLTNADTAPRFLNPGGFDPQKAAARFITILKSLDMEEFIKRFGSIDKLFTMKLDDLDKIVDEIKPKLNPLTPNTWVTLHQRNMSGAALIGIAANHNASHALMQRTKLGVTKDYALTINSHKYDSLHNILNEEGKYITRNVSGFLAAFVDNAKDPIAGDMNFNTTTADVAFTLLRLGVPVVTTGLIISQPVVKEIVDIVMNDRKSMYEAVNMIIDKYQNLANAENINNLPSKDGINSYDFTDIELANNILASHHPSNTSKYFEEATYYSGQLKIAYLFSKLNKLSSDLSNLTQATRADTQNGAAGPSVADDIVKIEKVEELLDSRENDNYSLTNVDFINFEMNTTDIVNSELPILQAFFTYGIESTKNLFGRMFPQYNDRYKFIIDALKAETKYNRLDVKTRNNIYNDIINYYITQFSDFKDSYEGKKFTREEVDKETGEVKQAEISARDYYINVFPAEFRAFKEAHPELNEYSFINRLKVSNPNKYNPVASITFSNVGNVTNTQKEQYIRDWTTLLYVNDETREMARKLFIYNCFKGFGFSPSGFSHLASTDIKKNNEEYMRGLNDVITNNFDVHHFVDQYIMNHLYNRQLVPDVSEANGLLETENEDGTLGIDTDEFAVDIDDKSPFELKQFAHPFGEDDEIIFHRFVHFNIKGRDLYFMKSEDDIDVSDKGAVYRKIQPLGLKNQYVEYEYGVSIEGMKSIIKEHKAQNAGFFNPYEDSNIEGAPTDYAPMSGKEDLNSLLEALGMGGAKPEANTTVKRFNSIAPDMVDDNTKENFCGYNFKYNDDGSIDINK